MKLGKRVGITHSATTRGTETLILRRQKFRKWSEKGSLQCRASGRLKFLSETLFCQRSILLVLASD